MAIKMRFHNWPSRGNSSYSYTDHCLGFAHEVKYWDHMYNWDNMPNKNITQANADIADLMYHTGVSVDMCYGTDCLPCNSGIASSADTLDAATAINFYFGYIETEKRRTDHFEHMQKSILAGLPVQAGCYGHSVIADGFRETDPPSEYFHINCGWEGLCNGWYNLNQLPLFPDCSGVNIGCSCTYGQPANYTYVNTDYIGNEKGTLREPYNSFYEGYNKCLEEGHLWLKGAKSYLAMPAILNKKMTLHSFSGNAYLE